MSLCAMSTEESGVKEELGRLSPADSSSSLSVTISRALATSGAFHTDWICVHLYISNPTLVTPVSLAEGRQEQICPTQLGICPSLCLLVGGLDTFLLMSAALGGRCCWRKINEAEPFRQVFFELPESLRGISGAPFSVMDRRRAGAPLYGWRDLG